MEIQSVQSRIVADSAADLTTLNQVPFAAAPLKVIAGEREFLDTEALNVAEMVDYLKTYKGKSTSSCPNPDEWLKTFGDAQEVFGVALTSGISGSYNAARAAQRIYEADHPDRRVYIVDSLSAGPGETILVEKLEELISAGMEFEQICTAIEEYRKQTGLVFILESLTNFANNGRVSPAVAKIAGFLGICIVGRASDAGTLEPLKKCRGSKKAQDAIVELLGEKGFHGGKIRIAHCFNEEGAHQLKDKIIALYPHADIRIYPTGALCSFYAEAGGLLVAYDTV